VAQTLLIIQLMSLVDFTILYFACGSPFAVYYFIQNRNWFKSIIIWMLWIPYSLRLLQRKVTSKLSFDKKLVSDSEIELIQKEIEQIVFENDSKLSLFEFREVFERYVGLTLTKKQKNNQIGENEINIFRVVKHENPKLGAICLNRRNQFKLNYHQTLARKDFLKAVNEVQSQKLQLSSLKLFRILEDDEAEKTLNVGKSELDLWNTNQQNFTRKPALTLQTSAINQKD
jgi:hypothetical protein